MSSNTCRCSHPQYLHVRLEGACVSVDDNKPLSWWCGCTKFVAQQPDDENRERSPGT